MEYNYVSFKLLDDGVDTDSIKFLKYVNKELRGYAGNLLFLGCTTTHLIGEYRYLIINLNMESETYNLYKSVIKSKLREIEINKILK